jgi:hypothetical protein
MLLIYQLELGEKALSCDKRDADSTVAAVTLQQYQKSRDASIFIKFVML